jgi:DNA processing protein
MSANAVTLQPLATDDGLRRLALTFVRPRTARDALGARRGWRIWDDLSDVDRDRVRELAEELDRRQIRMLLPIDPEWPDELNDLPAPPVYLFAWGSLDLLRGGGIGMCGSRTASDRGLEAARVCGREVARHDLHVVSGYARGVDTVTHLAALEHGAGTVIVLAEGILHFRVKRVFREVGLSSENVLVLSQFPPRQRWTAGAAMTRNGVICALGRALVVVEAGERGGTLNAGRQALGIGRPVFALQFGDDAPVGNRSLFDEGARCLKTTGQLRAALQALG